MHIFGAEEGFTLSNDLTGRTALLLSQEANRATRDDIYLEDGEGRRVNAKSLLGVLSLGLKGGERFSVYISRNSPETEQIVMDLLSVLNVKKEEGAD